MLPPRAACTNIIFVRASNAEKHAIKKLCYLKFAATAQTSKEHLSMLWFSWGYFDCSVLKRV